MQWKECKFFQAGIAVVLVGLAAMGSDLPLLYRTLTDIYIYIYIYSFRHGEETPRLAHGGLFQKFNAPKTHDAFRQ